MIVKFETSGLWNSEYPLVVNRIIDIAESHKPHTIHLGLSFDRLSAFRPQLAKIEAQERADKDSALLSELDQQRDTLYNVIYAVTKAFQSTPLADVSQHATQVMNVLKKHGSNIAVANYTAETKRLYDLIDDINSQPEVLMSLSALSLHPLVERLNGRNREFDRLFMLRNQRQSETERVDIRTIRNECDKALAMFWSGLEFCCHEYGKEAYMPMLNEINNLNAYYKQQLAARATRRKVKHDIHKEEPIQPIESIC